MTKETNREPETTPQTVREEGAPAKRANKKRIVIVVTAVAVTGLAVAGYFTYAAYQQQRQDLTSQIKTEQDKVSEIDKQNQKLADNLKDANAQIKSLKDAIKKTENSEVIIPKLALKINGATKDSRGYGYSGNYTQQSVIVDVTLTNNSNVTAYLSASDFRLKDGNNATSTTRFEASWPPTANKTALKTQAVAPGETVSGSILFDQVSTSFSTYTLYYLEDAQVVAPKDATYSWYTYTWCEGKEGTGELGC